MTERRSLEGVFALKPRTHTEPASEPVPPTAAAEPEPPARRPRSAPAGQSGGTARPLRELAATSFYVPAEQVATPWRARARETDQTLAEVLVAATQAVSTDQVVEALQRPHWDTAGGGMPSWETPATSETSVNVQVRLGAVQLQWLDDQVAAVGASSRSQYVATLLALHLAGTPSA